MCRGPTGQGRATWAFPVARPGPCPNQGLGFGPLTLHLPRKCQQEGETEASSEDQASGISAPGGMRGAGRQEAALLREARPGVQPPPALHPPPPPPAEPALQTSQLRVPCRLRHQEGTSSYPAISASLLDLCPGPLCLTPATPAAIRPVSPTPGLPPPGTSPPPPPC